MGGAGGIAALHNAGRTVQLQRISFVPAQHADTAPVPEGVEVISLGGGSQVLVLPSYLILRILYVPEDLSHHRKDLMV